ncbi:MAG: chlorophyllide reductase iron protein subunit X, partial [Pseudomonadota bacterium]
VEYFRKLGGNVGVAGLVINKDDGTGEAQAFADAVDVPVLCAIPADEDIRRKSANYQIVGIPDTQWGPLFEQLAINVAEAEPRHPKPLSQDGLLDLFSPEETGSAFELTPATLEDMCGKQDLSKPSLEVIYDHV